MKSAPFREEILAKFNEGSEVWKRYLIHTKGNLKGANLQGAQLEGAYLVGADLSGANLSDANLQGADLIDANLEDVNFSNADLKKANLIRGYLKGANLSGAVLENASLVGADLREVTFEGANLAGASLERANLSVADLSKAQLQGRSGNQEKISFKGAHLRGVNLNGANLGGINFERAHLRVADLKGANLSTANLEGVDFEGASLANCRLVGANLKNSNLKGADLTGADLDRTSLRDCTVNFKTVLPEKWELIHNIVNEPEIHRQLAGRDLSFANLKDANLRGANLEGANLFGADLENVNLINANLSQADLSRASLDAADLEGSNLENAKLEGTRLDKANLRKARLQSANLKGAFLKQVDLESAQLEAADLRNANMDGADLRSASLKGAKFDSVIDLPEKWQLVYDIVNNDTVDDLDQKDLSWANLSGVNLEGVNLEGANLRGAILQNANLKGANLKAANLRITKLKDAEIDEETVMSKKWLLVHSIICGTREEVDLVREDLSWAHLEGVDLEGFDLENADLRGSILIDANLKGSNLKGANLEGADLERANLMGANLEQANMDKAYIKEAEFHGARLSSIDMRGQVGGAQFYLEVFPRELDFVQARRNLFSDEKYPMENDLLNTVSFSQSDSEKGLLYRTHHTSASGTYKYGTYRYEKPKTLVDLGLVGISLSGGGIRSATLGLGVLQALDAYGMYDCIDYMSTVSGGGYIGSCISAELAKTSAESKKEKKKFSKGVNNFPFQFRSGQQENEVVHYLRNNSKYLSSGGSLFQGLQILLRGFFLNLFTFFLYLLFVSGVVELLVEVSRMIGLSDFIANQPNLVATLLFGVSVLSLAVSSKRVYYVWIMLFSSLNFLLAIGVILFANRAIFETYGLYIVGGGIGLCILGVLFSKGIRFFMVQFGSSLGVGIGLLVGVYILVTQVYNLEIFSDWYFLKRTLFLLTILGIVIIVERRYNPNESSMHKFYRERLSKGYLEREDVQENAESRTEPIKLSALGEHGPYHLINVALNLHGSIAEDLRGRNADFFIFSKSYIGGPRTGYCKTEEMEERDKHVNLGTAMAISGAAASPNMGGYSTIGLRFLLSLFNIRLGYWLHHPKVLTKGWAEAENANGFKKAWNALTKTDRVGPNLLRIEATGNLHERGSFINLSDGGHLENLGLYELLRRRCKYIIAVEGASDPDLHFNSLHQLVRFARIDMGIEIEIDLSKIRSVTKNDDYLQALTNGRDTGTKSKDAVAYSERPWAIGRIKYSGDPSQWGWLLFIKLTITKDIENNYIRSYKEQHPKFPHESIADQFFDEAQFEVYRELGYQHTKSFFESYMEWAGIEDKLSITHDMLDDLFGFEEETNNKKAGMKAGHEEA